MRIANGIVIDKEKTFGQLKFSALRREVRVQNEDGTISSLNTFLNAMTYPDKTVYPVASCNDKDFRNLMNVYLDAVFYPNIYETSRESKTSWKIRSTSRLKSA